MTQAPTDHRYVIGGKTMYTTDVPVHVEISPGGIRSVTPREAVASQRLRTDLVDNLRAEMCDHGHFFASAPAASARRSEHPDGRVLSVAAAFDEYRDECRELGWILPQDATRPPS